MRPVTPPFYPARPRQGGALFPELCHSLYADGSWFFQPKFNGWRALLHAPTGEMWNRHGEKLSITGEFTRAIAEIQAARRRAAIALEFIDSHGCLNLTEQESEWFDVEALDRRHARSRGSLVVLDIPMLKLNMERRGCVVTAMFPTTVSDCASPDTAYSPIARNVSQGLWLWQHLQERNRDLGITFYEGVVAKRRTSFYPTQLRSPSEESADWIKHRFTTQ